MSATAERGAVNVDPEIAVFVAELAKAYASHATEAPVTPSTRRHTAEIVRQRWSSGGPVMARSVDMQQNGIRLRIHYPVDQVGLPILFYVHGGGWTLFSVDTHDRLMREYAARAGIAVIGIDYSLAPESRFPVALDEIVSTLDWVEQAGEELGLDTARMVIGGDSAGANLSVAACLRRRMAGAVPLAGMLLNYGAFDPRRSESYSAFSGPEYTLEADEMDAFWSNYVADPKQLSDPLVAPANADLHDLPPAFLAIAECDVLVNSNVAFARQLRNAGVATEAVIYAGATHSFLEAVSISGLAERAFDDQARWLRQVHGQNADG